MADDLQSGVYSGNWWSSSSNTSSSSPCSSGLNDIGNFGWPLEITEINRKPFEGSENILPGSISGKSLGFPESHKGHSQDSGGVFMDSSLQMAGFGPSSTDWRHALLRSCGGAESNFPAVLQEEPASRSNFSQDSSMESAQLNQTLSLKQRLNSSKNSGDYTVTGRNTAINCNFSTELVPYDSPSTLLQGFFDQESQSQEQQFYENQVLNFPSGNYDMNLSADQDDFSASWSKFPQFINKSLLPKQQTDNQLHFPNNARFWNASLAMNGMRSNLFAASSHPQILTQTFEEKPNLGNLTSKINTEGARDSSSEMKKSSSEPAHKRPRLETPSPLPTFKVRKEKLGDRITALQQLVSPFGKTDTASVLWEAIDHIKFLHEQVNMLSETYMKNVAPIHHQQNSDKSKDAERPTQDLRSRGLCLVPIASTFTVPNEPISEFWTSSFGGTYR